MPFVAPTPTPMSEEESLRRIDEWRKKVITTCWRCSMFGSVDEGDDLGLCDRCKETLRDPDFVKEFYVPPMKDGPLVLDEAAGVYRVGERGF